MRRGADKHHARGADGCAASLFWVETRIDLVTTEKS
jgi:hypothetical protein